MSTVWPEVQIGRRGVEADLDRERLAAGELRLQRLRGDHVHASLDEDGEGLGCVHAASEHHEAPALEPVPALEKDPRRARVDAVLGLEDPRGQALGAVVREHGHGLLQNDRPRVEALVDQVNGGPAHLHAVVEGLSLGLEPGKGRQQRGVHVHHPARERADERRGRAAA